MQELNKHLNSDWEIPIASTTNMISMGAEKSLTNLHPSKKNPKVPKRIHKAEREKMKREHLNELFLQLADALEVAEANSGKAFILGETTRAVKDMFDQIKCLEKENAALLSESQYVKVERDELQEETTALEIQIGELKNTIKERTVQTNLDLNIPPIESQEPPFLNHVLVIPTCADHHQAGLEPGSGGLETMSNVSKPHPRYPTPSDSWPSQLLGKV